MSYIVKNLDPLVRGDDWNIKFQVTSGGFPVDITGFSYKMTLKAKKEDPDPGAVQLSGSSLVPAEAQEGVLFMKAARAATDSITPGNYNYDLQQIDAQGYVKTLLIGKVRVVADITRTTS